MERVVNVRPVAGAAVFTALGVLISSVCDDVLLRIVIPIAVFAVGIFLSFGLRRKGEKLGKVPLLIVISLIFFATGFAAMAIDKSNCGRYDGYGQVEGRVCATERYGYIIDDVSIYGRSYRGKMRVFIQDEPSIGDRVSFRGEVATYEVDFFDLSSASRYKDGIYYHADEPEDTVYSVGRLKFFERVAKRMTDPLFKYMDAEDAGVAKSLLFGDKSDMSATDKDVFRIVGVSHVFAVSGMHVGFLTAIVIFLLKKLNVRPVARLAIVSAAVIFYGFLTGFPSGIKRAFIMAFICMLAPILRRKNDTITSLCLACLIIIITNPRELFDVGFIMSVLSVGGIILFVRPMQRGISKVIKAKWARKVLSGVCMTIGASALLLPIYTDVFGSVALYAVLANPIILPVVTLTYFLLALAALLCAISPALGFLHYPIQYPIIAIRLVSNGIAALPVASVDVGALGVVGIIYIVALLFLSPVNKMKFLPKISFAAAASVASTLLLILL